jgi:hypothetical protein
MKLLRKLFTQPCCECKEVRVWFWLRRCSFCDKGEGETT